MTTNRYVSKEWCERQLSAGKPITPAALELYPELSVATPQEPERFSVSDVSPDGYGLRDSPSEDSVEAWPHGQIGIHPTTEEQSLMRSINEAKTLLKGTMTAEKRKQIESSLARSQSRLDEFRRHA